MTRTSDRNPHHQWDALYASVDFRVMLTILKGADARSYNLRPLENGGAEIWVNQYFGETLKTIQKETFREPDDAIRWLGIEEAALRKDGWR